LYNKIKWLDIIVSTYKYINDYNVIYYDEIIDNTKGIYSLNI